MQIMPSGGAWTNPAALTQQALVDSKPSSGTAKIAANSAEPVNPLEQSGKASDRDAQERYAGPEQSNALNSASNATDNEQESMLALPADDDLEASTLDLLG